MIEKRKRISKRILSQLSQLIMKFVSELEKFDPQDIFAMPVTDQIAPGYSTMIRNPMDFSTIKTKCEALEYEGMFLYFVQFLKWQKMLEGFAFFTIANIVVVHLLESLTL